MITAFELWKLKRSRRKTIEAYDKDIAECKADKTRNKDDLEMLYTEQGAEILVADDALDTYVSDILVEEARELDIETPDYTDKAFWQKNIYGNRFLLNAKGRSTVRHLIYEEKTRKFEVQVRWAKMALPIITALAGLAGVATGLVLAFKK
jgi:hypothetical protein